MKFLSMMFLLVYPFSLHAEIECKKGQERLKIQENTHMGNGPHFYGFEINGNLARGRESFQKILHDSQKCIDLRIYTSSIENDQVLVCDGEMFAIQTAYGSSVLSRGAPHVFMNEIAPVSGWSCQQVELH